MKLSEILERDRRYGDYKLHTIVYMVNEIDHIKIDFRGTYCEEAIQLIRNMEEDGFKYCSWLRWFLRKCGRLV